MLKKLYVGFSKTEQFVLIKTFHEMYFNTDQDMKNFSDEYYEVVNLILNGFLPLELEKLIDFKEIISKQIIRLALIFKFEGDYFNAKHAHLRVENESNAYKLQPKLYR